MNIEFIQGGKRMMLTNNKINNKTKYGSYRIAILEPQRASAVELIRAGVFQTLSKRDVVYYFSIFNACGKHIEMIRAVKQALDIGYDLLFCIGTEYTLVAKEIMKRNKKKVPIVFTEVQDPVRFGIVDSLDEPGDNLTGNAHLSRYYEEHLSFLLQAQKDVKDATLLYNPTQEMGLLEEHKVFFEQELKKCGVNLTALAAKTPGKMVQMLTKHLTHNRTHMILTLYDYTAMAAMKEFIDLANRFVTPLYVADLPSVGDGAAFGRGQNLYSVGVQGSKKIVRVLEHGQNPRHMQVDITALPYYAHINPGAMILQGMGDMIPRMIELCESSIFIPKVNVGCNISQRTKRDGV
jgi:ABC-type uncharacterized transport system substrate-binding protein